jgi:hypothetical protein
MYPRKQIALFLILSILISNSLSSCTRPSCLPEPETDVTPPKAGLWIAHHIGGTEEITAVTDEDAEATIQADENQDVFIIYSGYDDQGMKRLDLMVSVIRFLGGNIQQREEWNIAPKIASCPIAGLSETTTFEKNQGERTVNITLRIYNWKGLTGIAKTRINFVSP